MLSFLSVFLFAKKCGATEPKAVQPKPMSFTTYRESAKAKKTDRLPPPPEERAPRTPSFGYVQRAGKIDAYPSPRKTNATMFRRCYYSGSSTPVAVDQSSDRQGGREGRVGPPAAAGGLI